MPGVNFAARSVISPDPNIEPSECLATGKSTDITGSCENWEILWDIGWKKGMGYRMIFDILYDDIFDEGNLCPPKLLFKFLGIVIRDYLMRNQWEIRVLDFQTRPS